MEFIADKSINCNGQKLEFKFGCGYVSCSIKWYRVWMLQFILKINKTEYRIGLVRRFPWNATNSVDFHGESEE